MKMMRQIGKGHLFHFAVIVFCFVLSSEAQVQKRNYAVIGLKNAEGVSAGEADIIADRLRVELFNTGVVSMMERDQMTSILSEQGFQQSGACTDDACMVEMGQLLGVEKLISGSIGKLGSMFLLNFRTIDVQTAKIVKVVSKDITGGIEDVVKHLPEIAHQLVEGQVAEKPEVVAEPQKSEPEPEPEPEPEVTEMVKPEPVVTEEPVPEIKKKGKNENRSCLRLSFNFFPGGMTPYIYDESDNDYVKSELFDNLDELIENNGNESGYTTKDIKFHTRFQLDVMIAAGPFLAIDVAPGLMFMNQKYENDYEESGVYMREKVQFFIIAPNIGTGINFVKRFYPLKINAGFLVDLNFNIVRYKYTYTSSDFESDRQSSGDFSVNVSFGPRAGVELLAGKVFGISLDFLYRFSKVKAEDLLGWDQEEWKFKLPGVGFGVGFNFYF